MSNWWKEADPRFEPNGEGNYDLRFDQGEENFMNPHFKVGDEVQIISTGEGGHIEETLDVDLYSVMTDSGDIQQVNSQDLQPAEGVQGDPGVPTGVERFEEGDPEAQDFEDPGAGMAQYQFDVGLADVPELLPGDWVHVYNPFDANEDYIDMQGEVIGPHGSGYDVNFGDNTAAFDREELELLGRKGGQDPTLAWWKGAGPIRHKPGDLGPEDEGFSVPWGATQQDDGSYVPSVPDRRKTNPMKLEQTSPPTIGNGDWQRIQQEWGITPEVMVENIKRAYYSATNEQWQSGGSWYDLAQASAQKVVDAHGHTTGIRLDQVVAIQSVISPKLSWAQNERYPGIIVDSYMNQGIKDPQQWRDTEPDQKTGLPLKLALTNTKRTGCVKIMDGEPLENIFKGPKTQRFVSNIMGLKDEATVDVWATRVALGRTYPRSMVYSPSQHDYVAYYGPSNSTYEIFNNAYKQAAQEISEEEGEPVEVREVQAITWVVYKELGKKGDVLDITIDEVEQIQAQKRAAEEESGMIPGGEGVGRANIMSSWWRSAGGLEPSDYGKGKPVNPTPPLPTNVFNNVGMGDFVVYNENGQYGDYGRVERVSSDQRTATVALETNGDQNGTVDLPIDKLRVVEKNNDTYDQEALNSLREFDYQRTMANWWKGALRFDENGEPIIDSVEEADWANALSDQMDEQFGAPGYEDEGIDFSLADNDYGLDEKSPYQMASESEDYYRSLENGAIQEDDLIGSQLDAETQMFNELYEEGVEDARVGKHPREQLEFDSEEEFAMYWSGYDAYANFDKESWWSGAAAVSPEEGIHNIVETIGFLESSQDSKAQQMVFELRSVLSDLEGMSTLEKAAYTKYMGEHQLGEGDQVNYNGQQCHVVHAGHNFDGEPFYALEDANQTMHMVSGNELH